MEEKTCISCSKSEGCWVTLMLGYDVDKILRMGLTCKRWKAE